MKKTMSDRRVYPLKYVISHFVSFKREQVNDILAMKGGLYMEQIKIGSFLKKLRNEKGLTQVQLAEQLNVSNRSVSRWETGSTLPDISILITNVFQKSQYHIANPITIIPRSVICAICLHFSNIFLNLFHNSPLHCLKYSIVRECKGICYIMQQFSKMIIIPANVKKCLRHFNSPSPSFMRGIWGFFLCHFPP